MSQRFPKLRALFARLTQHFGSRPIVAIPADIGEFYSACKEMAFWSASDAGLEGPIEAFDGSALHRAADGMCTIRMTLTDSHPHRSPADAASAIFRALHGLRVLLLIEIDGSRFVKLAPNVNAGIQEMGESFTNRSGRAG